MEEVDEDQDPDLTLILIEGDIVEETLVLILETEEDIEEEALEREDQELRNQEEIEDSLETLEETVEETIEAFQNHPLIAKIVETGDHSGKILKINNLEVGLKTDNPEVGLMTDNPEVGLIVKKVKKDKEVKEKVFQEVILNKTLKEVKVGSKEMVFSNKCLKVK